MFVLAIDPASTSGFAWWNGEDLGFSHVDGLLNVPSCDSLQAFLEQVKTSKGKLTVVVENPRGYHGSSQVNFAGNQIVQWLKGQLPLRTISVQKVSPNVWQREIIPAEVGDGDTKSRSRNFVQSKFGWTVTSDEADAICILHFHLGKLGISVPKTSLCVF